MSYSKSKARDPLRTRCFSCWGCGTSPEETPSRSSGAEGEQESEGQGAAEVNTVKQLQKKKKKKKKKIRGTRAKEMQDALGDQRTR